MHDSSAMEAETFIRNMDDKDLNPGQLKLKVLDVSGVHEFDSSITESIPDSSAHVNMTEVSKANNTEKFDKKRVTFVSHQILDYKFGTLLPRI